MCCYKIRILWFWIWIYICYVDAGSSLEYIYFSDKQSWNTASHVCQSIGGRLATVNSESTVDLLKNIINNEWSLDIVLINTWIGLHRLSDRTFSWSDPECTTLDTDVWENFESSADVAYSELKQCFRQRYDQLQWDKQACSEHERFICERPGNSNSVNSTVMDSYRTDDDGSGIPTSHCRPSAGSLTPGLNTACPAPVQATVTITPTTVSTFCVSTVTVITSSTTTVVNTVTMAPTPVTEAIATLTPDNTLATTVSSPDVTSSVLPACDLFCTSLSNVSLSKAELTEVLEKIVTKLKVDTRILSTTIRKKTSAPDYRRSSTTMGCTAGLLMIVPFVIIMVADIPVIFKNMKNFRQ